eukprot:289299_1
MMAAITCTKLWSLIFVVYILVTIYTLCALALSKTPVMQSPITTFLLWVLALWSIILNILHGMLQHEKSKAMEDLNTTMMQYVYHLFIRYKLLLTDKLFNGILYRYYNGSPPINIC